MISALLLRSIWLIISRVSESDRGDRIGSGILLSEEATATASRVDARWSDAVLLGDRRRLICGYVSCLGKALLPSNATNHRYLDRKVKTHLSSDSGVYQA
jgi:hypothetical protein